jgi:surface polysaccharide O-acyltransferase-like enzyme
MVVALNLTWLAALQYAPRPGFWWAHAYELLPTYSMYVLAGCYAGMHFERLHDWAESHRSRLLVIAGAAAIFAECAYALQLGAMPPRTANAVLQPAMLASCVAALIVVYLIGARWAAGPRSLQPTVQVASEISFGVYLAHPLVLTVLLDHGLGNGQQIMPAIMATVVAFLGAGAGAAALCLVIRRTPLAHFLIGRTRLSTTRKEPLVSLTVS